MKKIKYVLFDLDGTLLPMDQEEFTKGYFKYLAKKMIPHGYEPEKLIESIWTGIAAMVKNDGTRNNESAFWDRFTQIYGNKALDDMPVFNEFYKVDFQVAKTFCGFNPLAHECVHALKNAGYHVVLATNPLFPSVATKSRIRWAGLEPEDFELYTTYENIGFCKPNPEYYKEILNRLGADPSECIMIGNDVNEDMIAQSIGMDVFLLTDCLINSDNKDISNYNQGNFNDLMKYLGI